MGDIEEGIQQEFQLAQQMKETFCNKTGKETNTPKTAEILHQLGQIYKTRSPDKLSLIKSVGLFNAAIVRNPANISQIKTDLFNICQHVLHLAKAENQNANLVGKAEQAKISLNKFRSKVKTLLKKSAPQITALHKGKVLHELKRNKISEIQNINRKIFKKYKKIMKDISQFCEKVLGKPPCEYAVVGMGSLARQEITPYSDFEHIILLNDNKSCCYDIEYFRWFSVIFHVIVLNLQETILPSLNISSLNDKTSSLGDWFYDAVAPRGVSFDGMMPHACKFPLGRQQHTENKQWATELIKPVSEMLEYLSFEADLKNGYHLADILTKTCFVSGNKDLFQQFVDEIESNRVKELQANTIINIRKQVKDDLNNFSTRFRLTNLKSQNTINIKQLVYRSTTIFIAALARKNNISAASGFDIIDEMYTHKHITQSTAERLKYAVAIACEMRLRVYMDKESQSDDIVNVTPDGIEKFLKIVGKESTINYFQIAYCLQCEVAKQFNLTKLHFYSDPQLINTTIALTFGMSNAIDLTNIKIKNSVRQFNNFDFDSCIQVLEEHDLKYFTTEHQPKSQELTVEHLQDIAIYLCSAKVYDEAIDFFKQLLQIYETDSEHKSYDNEIADVNHAIGVCFYHLKKYSMALNFFHQAHQIKQTITYDSEKDLDIARILLRIGECKLDLFEYEDAWNHLKEALNIFQNTNTHMETFVAQEQICYCLLELNQVDNGLKQLKLTYSNYWKLSTNITGDENFSVMLNNTGYHLMNAHLYDEALTYLTRSLELTLKLSFDVEQDISIAATQSNIGRCLVGLKRYDEAWEYLEKSLKIKQKVTLEEGKDQRIAYSFQYMGECLAGKQEYKSALSYFQQAQKIYETITPNAEKDLVLAHTLHHTGLCLVKLDQYDEASTCLNQSLEIYQNLVSNQHIKSIIEDLHCKINQCAQKLSVC